MHDSLSPLACCYHDTVVIGMLQAANEAGPKPAQRFGAELYRQQEAEANRGIGRLNRSGDADVPARQQLHERRAKFDDARARQASKAGQPSISLSDSVTNNTDNTDNTPRVVQSGSQTEGCSNTR